MKSFPLNLCAIPFAAATRMAQKHVTEKEQRETASGVVSIYGLRGILALWCFQGYYDPTEMLSGGLTPATRWWLDPGNTWTDLVRDILAANIGSADDAVRCLQVATCVPNSDINMVDGTCVPGEITKPSEWHATYVRQLALLYFPQFPELALPTCTLYRDAVPRTGMVLDNDDISGLCYEYPMQAFAGDVHAQRYLALALPGSPMGQFPVEMIEFRYNRNDTWKLYEQMGLTLEEMYALACAEVNGATLALPDGLAEPSNAH